MNEKEHKDCPLCHRPLPLTTDEQKALSVPLSKHHIRCSKCFWPVAESIIKDGICRLCSKKGL